MVVHTHGYVRSVDVLKLRLTVVFVCGVSRWHYENMQYLDSTNVLEGTCKFIYRYVVLRPGSALCVLRYVTYK